jgi:hypothetical protein
MKFHAGQDGAWRSRDGADSTSDIHGAQREDCRQGSRPPLARPGSRSHRAH